MTSPVVTLVTTGPAVTSHFSFYAEVRCSMLINNLKKYQQTVYVSTHSAYCLLVCVYTAHVLGEKKKIYTLQ